MRANMNGSTKQPTPKQEKLAKAIIENMKLGKPKPKCHIIKSVGYSSSIQSKPKAILESQGFLKAFNKYITDDLAINVHKNLLSANKLSCMTFPLGPEEQDEIDPFDNSSNDTTDLTDDEIISMLKDVGCQVQKITYGETKRYVYFWSPDNLIQDKALDKVYKIKGAYAPEKHQTVNLNISTEAEDSAIKSITEYLNEKNSS